MLEMLSEKILFFSYLLAVSSLSSQVYGDPVLHVRDAGAGPGHEEDPDGVLVAENAGEVEDSLTLTVLTVHLGSSLY